MSQTPILEVKTSPSVLQPMMVLLMQLRMSISSYSKEKLSQLSVSLEAESPFQPML